MLTIPIRKDFVEKLYSLNNLKKKSRNQTTHFIGTEISRNLQVRNYNKQKYLLKIIALSVYLYIRIISEEEFHMRGDRLKLAREKLNMTLQTLGEYLNVSPSAISRWEKEGNEPNDEMKKKIASYLGVSVAYLVGETDYPQPLDIILNQKIISYGEKTISIPVLEPSAVACAGRGSVEMDSVYAEASEVLSLPMDLIGQVSVDIDKKPFVMRVEGVSMEGAGIPDRTSVVINPIEPIYDGDTAMECFGRNNTVAIKWVYFNVHDGSVEIRSASPQYAPLKFTREDCETGLFRIIGKVMLQVGRPKKGV